MYQMTSKTNLVVDSKEWKERLPNMYIWLDYCCIPVSRRDSGEREEKEIKR